MRVRLPHDVKRAVEIDVDDRFEAVCGQVSLQREKVSRGALNEHVNGPKPLDSMRHRALDSCVIANVDNEPQCRRAATHARDRCLHVIGLAAHDDHRCVAQIECLRDRQIDASGPAEDQDVMIREIVRQY